MPREDEERPSWETSTFRRAAAILILLLFAMSSRHSLPTKKVVCSGLEKRNIRLSAFNVGKASPGRPRHRRLPSLRSIDCRSPRDDGRTSSCCAAARQCRWSDANHGPIMLSCPPVIGRTSTCPPAGRGREKGCHAWSYPAENPAVFLPHAWPPRSGEAQRHRQCSMGIKFREHLVLADPTQTLPDAPRSTSVDHSPRSRA